MALLLFNINNKNSSLLKKTRIVILLCTWMILLLLCDNNNNNNNAPFQYIHGLAVTSKKKGGTTRTRPATSSPPRTQTHTHTRNVVLMSTSTSTQESSSTSVQDNQERTIVILYNKPPNVITSHESQDSRSTVYEDIQRMRGFLPSPSAGSNININTSSTSSSRTTTKNKKPSQQNKLAATTTANVASFEEATGIRSKLHAIGRLDADTTGLLLLTNDGRLVHHVTNPDAKTQEHERYNAASDSDSNSETTTSSSTTINKTYRALIMGHHSEESLQPLKYGVDIGKNYATKPLSLGGGDLQIIEHPNHKSTIVSITISEGKNRQVRKMFHAIGSGVMKLQRTRIGEHLTLEGVNEGEWRVLTDNEVQQYLNWNPREIVASASASGSTVLRPKDKRRRGSNSSKPRRRRRRR